MKTSKDVLAATNSEVEGLARRFALKVTNDGDADLWDEKVSKQLDDQRDLALKQAALEEAKKPLSASYKITRPTDRKVDAELLDFTSRFGPNGILSEPWSDLIEEREAEIPKKGSVNIIEACNVSEVSSPVSCLAAHMDLVMHFVTDWPQPDTWTKDQTDEANRWHIQRHQTVGRDDGYVSALDTTTKSLNGLLYREPARGGIVICLRKGSVGKECRDDRLVEPEMVNFPQFGQLRFIPFSVLPFQGKDQSIDFTEDGFPSKIVLKSTKAAGAEALAAGADAVTSIADALEKREEEKRSDIKAAREEKVAKLTNEIDLLEKEKKIEELRAPDSPPSAAGLRLAEINADIEQKRATLLQILLTNGIATGTIDPAVLFGS